MEPDPSTRSPSDPWWDLHRAAYHGRVDVVRHLLAGGADPNQPHAPDDSGWICGPTPVSKAITAWAVTGAHVEVVRLLLAAGARVEPSHLQDHRADAVGSQQDAEIVSLLERALSTRSIAQGDLF